MVISPIHFYFGNLSVFIGVISSVIQFLIPSSKNSRRVYKKMKTIRKKTVESLGYHVNLK